MISQRDRYKAIARFERPGDLWYRDTFWNETPKQWMAAGAPGVVLSGPRRGEYFGFGHSRGMGEIASGLGNAEYIAGDVEAYRLMAM